MNILAIDTSGKTLSLALLQRQDAGLIVKGEVLLDIGFKHSEMLRPLSQFLLQQCSCNLEDLTALSVCTGPGSFTGIRVGVSFARALAQSLNLPLVGVPIFDALKNSNTVIIIESIAQDVFVAIYDHQQKLKTDFSVISLDELLKGLDKKTQWKFLGSGALKYQDQIKSIFKKSVVIDPIQQVPLARQIALFAAQKLQIKNQKFLWKDVVPLYLRAPIAQERATYRQKKGIQNAKKRD